MIIKTREGAADRVPEGACVMLGYFDGFHRGHMALADAACRIREQKNASCVVLWTFSKLQKGRTITDNEEKAAAFFSYLPPSRREKDAVVLADFNSFSHLTGEEFVRDILHGELRASSVVCGFNFRFGANRASDAADLTRYCEPFGITCQVVPPVIIDGEMISSTGLRQLIAAGGVETAAHRMGRAYGITGVVEHGKRLGHTLGFPTVNLRIPKEKVTPAFGVYACRVRLCDGSEHRGVCNIGSRPTVNGDATDVTLETYIFDYDGDLYGTELTVSLCKKLRDETRFSSPDALAQQVATDKALALDYFEGRRCAK